MKINIRKEIAELSDEIYYYRRHFHKYPELSFKEFKTAETISKYLKELKVVIIRSCEYILKNLLISNYI